jgi:hypothetical protein
LGRIRAGYSFSQSHQTTIASENGNGWEKRFGYVLRLGKRHTKPTNETLAETEKRQTNLHPASQPQPFDHHLRRIVFSTD